MSSPRVIDPSYGHEHRHAFAEFFSSLILLRRIQLQLVPYILESHVNKLHKSDLSILATVLSDNGKHSDCIELAKSIMVETGVVECDQLRKSFVGMLSDPAVVGDCQENLAALCTDNSFVMQSCYSQVPVYTKSAPDLQPLIDYAGPSPAEHRRNWFCMQQERMRMGMPSNPGLAPASVSPAPLSMPGFAALGSASPALPSMSGFPAPGSASPALLSMPGPAPGSANPALLSILGSASQLRARRDLLFESATPSERIAILNMRLSNVQDHIEAGKSLLAQDQDKEAALLAQIEELEAGNPEPQPMCDN